MIRVMDTPTRLHTQSPFREDDAARYIEALERSRAVAESANRAKSELLARLNRELRTPLTGIVGFTDLLLAQKLDDKLRRLVQGIAASSDALLAVADEIQDFACFESADTALDPEALDPRQLIASVAELFSARTRGKNLGLEVEIGNEVPARVLLDAARLRQVLIHLMGNAVNATVVGGVSIRVQLGDAGPEPRLRFAVSDTGSGIPAERIPTLFDPFDPEAKGRDRGRGLGLALSRRKVEEMGGILEVESSLGVGSTFTLEVPFETPGGANVVDDQAREGLGGAVPKTPVSVLVVEDNELNRTYMLHQLESFGYRTTVAVNGYEALALLATEPFDLVLMDCQMPGLDGYETSKRLRRRESEGQHIPIVAVTADVMDGDRERCLAAGMDDYLTKPFQACDLEAKLAKWLGGGSGPAVTELSAVG